MTNFLPKTEHEFHLNCWSNALKSLNSKHNCPTGSNGIEREKKRNASEKKNTIGYYFSGPKVIQRKDVRRWSVLFRIRMSVCLAACSPEWQAHTTRSNIRLRPACIAFLCRNLFTVQSKRWSMHGKTTKDTYRIVSYDRADCAEHFIENRAARRSANTKSKLSIDTYSSYMHTHAISTIHNPHTKRVYIGLCVH